MPKFSKKDVTFRYARGKGPGGQHRNKTDSCVVARHEPTGIEVLEDGRNQHQNKRVALRKLREAVEGLADSQRAAKKKAKRDHDIHNTPTIRTYDYSRDTVTDHRTKKTASIKDILVKGRLEKLGLGQHA